MEVGDVLVGRYELVDELGRGGMGRVMRAHDRTLGRTVAIKLLATHLLGDEDAVAALREEARTAAAVRHPNVVQVLDVVLDDTDRPAIVMEHVDGPTLAAVVPEQGLSIDEALALLAGIGAGLRAVHDAGLVHRDVTPGNVLLDAGVPRLTDFGIARSAAVTATQTVRGSVGYLAPEQASGGEIGPATDVYALACLATRLLTGRTPFRASTAVGVVTQHLAEPPPDLRDFRPDVPAAVAAGVAAALAKDPADRPRSVDAFLRRLGAPTGPTDLAATRALPVATAAAPEPTLVATAGADGSPGATTVLADPGTTMILPEDPPQRRRPVWPIAAGVLAVVAVLLALVGPGNPTEEAPGTGGEPAPAVVEQPAEAASTDDDATDDGTTDDGDDGGPNGRARGHDKARGNGKGRGRGG